MVSEKSLTLTLNARLTYNIIVRLTQAKRLANEIGCDLQKDGLVRPSKVPVNESSPAMYPAKIGYSLDTTSPRANHLKRHPANETRKRIISSVQYCHETHARDTITKYVHEVYSTMIAKVSRNSNKCKTDTCNPRN